MSGAAVLDPVSPRTREPHRGARIVLSVVFAIAVTFVAAAAVPYFLPESESLQRYGSRGWVLLVHIITGTFALLTGPLQLWLGITDRRPDLHRKIGMAYLASVSVSSVAAFYLAFNTDFGWVFGAGLTGLAVAWLTTTGMVFTAIRRHLYDQHKEWMIRSYVVTTAFVTFRMVIPILVITGTGTLNEQLGFTIWISWSIPLLVTEAVIQGRKVLAVKSM